MGEGKWRRWFNSIVFVVVIALAFYVILDFEFPHVASFASTVSTKCSWTCAKA